MRRLFASMTMCALCGMSSLMVGCGVQEERQMEFSPDGNSVSFQHGGQGVFIRLADGELRKIHQPTQSEPAVSVPLWSPDGSSVIFCTGRFDDAADVTRDPDWDESPDGRVFPDRPATFTVWQYRIDEPNESEQLFESHTAHIGLIAAGLAIRWHPNGRAILYVDDRAETQPDEPLEGDRRRSQHALREYSLATGATRLAFPHRADVLLAANSPDHAHLVVIAGNSADSSTRLVSGIWHQKQDGDADWWRVPAGDFVTSANGNWNMLISKLRRQAPIWTDGNRFFFASRSDSNDKSQSTIHVVNTKHGSVEDWATVPFSIGQLRVGADGKRIGGLRQHEGKQTIVLLEDGKVIDEVSEFRIGETIIEPQHFLGWNGDGTKLCAVGRPASPTLSGLGIGRAAEHVEVENQPWALLLAPTDQRSHIVMGDADGSNATSVFSGMRVGFARWAPQSTVAANDAKPHPESPGRLAFWATFAPSHQDILSVVMGQFGAPSRSSFGLRLRDPAVILDLRSGELEWMPVNSLEVEQIGHYHQIQGDHAKAWQWYERAEKRRAEEIKEQPESPETKASKRRLAERNRDSALFRYICLRRLGRDADAEKQHREFERLTAILMQFESDRSNAARDSADALFAICLSRDTNLAGAFLSVNAADEADDYFRKLAKSRETLVERSTAKLAHLQLLLVAKRFDEYATLALKDYASEIPQLKPAWLVDTGDSNAADFKRFVSVWTHFPILTDRFVAALTEPKLRESASEWKARMIAEKPLNEAEILGQNLEVGLRFEFGASQSID